MGSNCDYKRPVRTQSGELRMEQSARLAASSKSARVAVQFRERAAAIAENMAAFQRSKAAFQPGAEKLEAIFEGSKRSSNVAISSRDTRTSRNSPKRHALSNITLSKVGQNRMFSKCTTLV